MFEITGTLKAKKDTRQATDSFRVREFVVTDSSSQYEQHIQFQVTQDRCDLLDNIELGSVIKVGFFIRGREWASPDGELKYFNSLDAFRLDVVSAQVSSGAPAADAGTPAGDPFTADDNKAEDDLPF